MYFFYASIRSVVKFPVVANVPDGTIKVAKQLPFKIVAALVAAKIVGHHLLVAGRVVQIGH